MDFPHAIASGFRNYVGFSGRASRAEYWNWILFMVIGRAVTQVMDIAIFHAPPKGSGTFTIIFSLIVFLPTFAVGVRRLHDVDRSGWWLLMDLTIIGIVYPLLFWKCRKGIEGPNRFGPDPLGMGWVVSQFE